MSPKDNNKQVSAAVRILHQKRDASARATHLMVKNDSLITYEKAFLGQAAIKKFFIATFLERKIMSTKTSFKRIAAVAALALTLGGFSAVSAYAGAGDLATNASLASVQVTAPTAPTAGTAAAFTIGITPASTITAGTADSLAMKAAITSAPTGGIAPFTGAFVAVTNWTDGATTASGAGVLGATLGTSTAAAGTKVSLGTLSFTPAKAGTYSITFYHDQSADGTLSGSEVYQTATITVGAANGYSNATSSIFSNALSTDAIASSATAATNAEPTRAKAMSATRAGTITVSLNTATNTSAHSFVTKVEAIVAGQGYVNVIDAALPGSNGCYANAAASPLRSDSVAPSQQLVNIAVCSDGTAGAGTVTIKVTDTDGVSYTLGSVKTNFTDTAKSLALVATNYTVAKAGGGDIGQYATMGTRDAATKIPATILVTKDSAGNAVTHASDPSGLSSNTAVLVGGTCAVDSGNATYGSGGAGYYNCYVTSSTAAKSGDKATITWRVLNSDAVTYTSLAAIDYTIGGAISKTTYALDAGSYATGDPMTLTITVKDSTGNAAYDGQAVLSAQSTSSKTVTGLPTTTALSTGGKWSNKVNTLFAPSTTGDFSLFFEGGDALATVGTVAGTVDGDPAASLALDAANAATDAANNAYDEAQNATQAASDALAAVTALATQVTSLIASVKKLTAAVAKLNKKK